MPKVVVIDEGSELYQSIYRNLSIELRAAFVEATKMVRTEIPLAGKDFQLFKWLEPKTIASFEGDQDTKPTLINECEHQWHIINTDSDTLNRGMVALQCGKCAIAGCAGMRAWFGWIPVGKVDCDPIIGTTSEIRSEIVSGPGEWPIISK